MDLMEPTEGSLVKGESSSRTPLSFHVDGRVKGRVIFPLRTVVWGWLQGCENGNPTKLETCCHLEGAQNPFTFGATMRLNASNLYNAGHYQPLWKPVGTPANKMMSQHVDE